MEEVKIPHSQKTGYAVSHEINKKLIAIDMYIEFCFKY